MVEYTLNGYVAVWLVVKDEIIYAWANRMGTNHTAWILFLWLLLLEYEGYMVRKYTLMNGWMCRVFNLLETNDKRDSSFFYIFFFDSDLNNMLRPLGACLLLFKNIMLWILLRCCKIVLKTTSVKCHLQKVKLTFIRLIIYSNESPSRKGLKKVSKLKVTVKPSNNNNKKSNG